MKDHTDSLGGPISPDQWMSDTGWAKRMANENWVLQQRIARENSEGRSR